MYNIIWYLLYLEASKQSTRITSIKDVWGFEVIFAVKLLFSLYTSYNHMHSLKLLDPKYDSFR